MKQATLDESFGNKTVTKTKSIHYRSPHDFGSNPGVYKESDPTDDHHFIDPNQNRNIVIIKGKSPTKLKAEEASNRSPSLAAEIPVVGTAPIISTELTARKKQKKPLDVFDKKHVENMNKKYLAQTPRLEENLKINKIPLTHIGSSHPPLVQKSSRLQGSQHQSQQWHRKSDLL